MLLSIWVSILEEVRRFRRRDDGNVESDFGEMGGALVGAGCDMVDAEGPVERRLDSRPLTRPVFSRSTSSLDLQFCLLLLQS